MLVLRNARIIPELTEGYDSDRADIVIDNGIIQEIKAANCNNKLNMES